MEGTEFGFVVLERIELLIGAVLVIAALAAAIIWWRRRERPSN